MPKNRFGEEPALEGEAYGGLVVFSRAKWRYREYLSAKLKRDLAPGEWVCVSVWSVRGGNGWQLSLMDSGSHLSPATPAR